MMIATEKAIPLLDLKAQYAKIQPEIEREVHRVLESQRFIGGPDVEKFEREIADYCGVKYAVGCASGSDAILLALKSLGAGPGDEVLTVPYSFFASAGYIVHAGAQPVFVDVERDTFNMDVSQVRAALDRHPKVKVIMPVHLFGACADMDPILEIAAERGLAVVEDAAQSIGAEYKNGRRAGSMGVVNCFSFYPGKNLGAYGDAGMVTTDDEAISKRLRALREHGGVTRYVHEWIGWNSRLDALQAAILSVKMRYLDEWTEARRKNADLYRRLFAERGTAVMTPVVAGYATRHVTNQFVVRCGERRDELRRYLAARGIGSEVYYPIPLHLQTCFAYLGYGPGSFPLSEGLAKETLALPVHPELTREDVERVVSLVSDFLGST
jgi:dTDP-4-amino-4,6-dideoxygalactose transaminase